MTEPNKIGDLPISSLDAYDIRGVHMGSAKLMLRSGKWSVNIVVEDVFAARRLLSEWGARRIIDHPIGETR